MKSNEIILNVTLDELKDSLEEIVNGNERFFSISDNLFLIKNINTCLHTKKSNSWFNRKGISFKFSYSDESFKNMITVKYNFSDDSCFAFLKETDYVSQEQIQAINSKVMKLAKQVNSYKSLDEEVEQINEMTYSEALLLITSAINKEDFDSVKSDFESKYIAWRKRKESENSQACDLINSLYNKLIKIKLSETI